MGRAPRDRHVPSLTTVKTYQIRWRVDRRRHVLHLVRCCSPVNQGGEPWETAVTPHTCPRYTPHCFLVFEAPPPPPPPPASLFSYLQLSFHVTNSSPYLYHTLTSVRIISVSAQLDDVTLKNETSKLRVQAPEFVPVR